MRQLSMAMLMYIGDNKGRFPAAEFSTIAGVYPYGWWWPNELVRGNYIKQAGLSVYKKPNSNTTDKVFSRNNPFRCPEGLDEDSGFTGGAGDYPTDPKNNAFKIGNDAACALEGLGIPSWYQLNCRNTSATNDIRTGARVTPFMGFQSGSQNNIALVKDPAWQRNMGLVKKGAELLMIVEAADQNWYDQTDSTKFPGNFLRRLGARHGKKTADGANAFSNFAFFDGHVSLYPTRPFENPANQMDNQVKEVIFYVNKQWKPN